MNVCTGAIRGLGKSSLAAIITFVGTCLFRVVWIYTVFAATPTLEILYLCYPVSWLFTICMQIVAFIVMRRKALKRYGTPLEIT
jgi:Na+-driven multidrug efflux pump